MSKLDTKDWRFRLTGKYEPKRTPTYATCTGCGGDGKRFRGFGVYDEDDDGRCQSCYGAGKGAVIDPLEPQPELSPALVAHLQRELTAILVNLPECFRAEPVADLFQGE